jgi:hypothetical protein
MTSLIGRRHGQRGSRRWREDRLYGGIGLGNHLDPQLVVGQVVVEARSVGVGRDSNLRSLVSSSGPRTT